MKYTPIADRVVLKVVNIEQKTAGGIIIPTTEDRPSDMVYAEVLECGKGRYEKGELNPMTVKVGDIVLLRPNMALHHDYMGQEVLIIRETEIASIVEGVEVSKDTHVFEADAFKEKEKQLESLL